MKKTFQELQEIDAIVAEIYTKNPKLKESKFGYWYKRFSEKNYQPIFKEFSDEIGLARIDNALEDKATKEILVDRTNPRGFKYSKEGLRACVEAENKILEKFYSKEIEVMPCISPSVPDELSEEQKEKLKGLVI